MQIFNHYQKNFLLVFIFTLISLIFFNAKLSADKNFNKQNSWCMTCGTATACPHKACTNDGCSICCGNDNFFTGNCQDCPCEPNNANNNSNYANQIQSQNTILQECRINNCQSTNNVNLPCTIGKTIFIPRSQGSNAARQIVGLQPYFHKPVAADQLLVTGQTISYTQSFRSERIANYLFGTTRLTFTGSAVSDRTRCQFLADSIGLCPNFVGTLSINPKIQNIIFENQFFFSLNCIRPGLYIIANFPLVHTRWSLGLCPQSQNTTCAPFDACAVSKNVTKGTNNLLEALSGNFLFGDMQTPFKFGKISDKTLTLTRLANINLIFGYDLYQDPKFYYGFFFEVVTPTGNRPNSRFLFEPIVGNGHHWEFGGGITGNLPVWSDGASESLLLYIDAHVTHMFKSKQCRSFDFCSRGPLSRYSLLQEFNETDVYTGNLLNAINFTTKQVNVSRTVKGDVIFKLAYYNPCLTLDVGYNFYGHTGEKVCLIKNSQSKFKYAFKNKNICQNSIPNKFLSTADLLLESGTSPATVTHKLFAYLDYYFFDRVNPCRTYIPYIGLGAEIEVNGLACNEENSSLNQWGIWLKGGFSF